MNSTQSNWQDALNQVVVHQQLLEVHPVAAGPAPEAFLCGVEVLKLATNGALLLALPADPQHRAALAAAEALWITVSDDRHRWIGRCTVEEVSLKDVDPAKHRLRLAPASEIVSGQRRDFFRLDTSGLDVPPVEIAPLSEPHVTPRLVGKMLNISGSGLGLAVSQSDPQAHLLRRGPQFMVHFQLPTMPDKAVAVSQLMHVKPLPERMIYLGLRFLLRREGELQRMQDQILRGITHLEREYIRRNPV